jgi:hypothetical protein
MTQSSDLHARVTAAQPRSPMPAADDEFVFAPASKAQAKARLAMAGPSGSGKTYTSLAIATALGSRIGCIDTEHGTAEKYADLFPFNHIKFGKPYDPRRLVRALAAAAAQSIDVLIIDSLSHFWQGAGGMLDIADGAARRSYGGNTWAGWKDANPVERDLIESMLAFPGHLIVTMRVKTEYIVDENDRGKKAPRKIGLKPIQREGLEYEFDVVGDLDLSQTLTIAKSRCPDLSGAVIHQPGRDVAERLQAWLQDGAPARTAADLYADAKAEDVTVERLRDLYTEADQLRIKDAAVQDDTGQPVRLSDYIAARGRAITGPATDSPAPAGSAGQAPAA